MPPPIYTIGHSTHPIERFLGLLARHGIDALCDVRSAPYSKFNPQYRKEALERSLRDHGKKYVFLGRELGARSRDPACFKDGRVRYDLLARTDLFKSGIDRLMTGIGRGYRMALMCAERDPLDCHRTLLVARNLPPGAVEVSHILADGSLEPHAEATARLVKRLGLDQDDLFLTADEKAERAFRRQEDRIAGGVGSG